MRPMIIAFAMAAFAGPVAASETKEDLCRARADLVVEAFNSRAEGGSKRQVRRGLRQALDRQAGDLLAEFVFSVPEESLTKEQIDAAGAMFFDQCKTL